MAMAAESGALTAQLRFVAQRDVNHAALTAVHRVKSERLARMLHFFGGSGGAQAQLGDAQHAVIVRVEREARMIFGRHAQRFHGDLFQRQQKLGLVREQQIDIGAAELHHNLGILDLRVYGLAFGKLILQIEIRILENHFEEVFDLRPDGLYRIFLLTQIAISCRSYLA